MTRTVEAPRRSPRDRDGLKERLRASTMAAVGSPDMDGLSSTLRRGATYSAIALLFGQAVSFVQTLVLARLLSPEELGVYAVGTVLTGFLVSVSEGGLRGALIQREENVGDAADTVFWVTGVMGLLLAFGAVGTAPIIGLVFNDTTAGVIAASTAGTLLIHGLTNVPDGLMQRQFNFRRRLIVDPARMLVFAVVTVGFAAAGYGAWSQVIGNYAGMLTWLVLTWWFAGWVPGFAKPSYRLWREMAKFSFPLMLEALVYKIRTTAETAVIGRGLSTDAVGQYRYGQRLSLLPGNAVVQIGSYVLFPAFARLAGDPQRLKSAFVRALQWSWIASAAVAGLTIAIGEPAVVVLLGAEWRDAGYAFVAMSGFGLGIALQAAGSEAIKATGRSELLNWTTGVSIVLGVGLLVALIPFGLIGVGLAISVTELVVGVVVLVLSFRVIPFSVASMFGVLGPPTLVTAMATAVVGYLDHAVVHSELHGMVMAIVLLVVETLLFGLLFLGGMALVAPALARRAVKAVRGKLRRGSADDEDEDEAGDDEVERRNPYLDPPTMMLPVLGMDETVMFRPRSIEHLVSPVARTVMLPVITPRAQAGPGQGRPPSGAWQGPGPAGRPGPAPARHGRPPAPGQPTAPWPPPPGPGPRHRVEQPPPSPPRGVGPAPHRPPPRGPFAPPQGPDQRRRPGPSHAIDEPRTGPRHRMQEDEPERP